MLATQAHSFTQQARLAITLAWVGGYTNILSILTCGTVTSHVSGTTSELGRHLSEGRWDLAGFVFWLLMMFFFGAAGSGIMTELGRRRGWESIYVLPIAVEAALLAAFALAIETHDPRMIEAGTRLWLMTGLASFAMGLQNATITRISSGVVRTTHVTGVLTDLGLETVQFVLWLKDRGRDGHSPVARAPSAPRELVHSVHVHPTARRLVLLLSIVASFALGAGLGTAAYDHIHTWAMYPPVAFLIWVIYQDLIKPIADIAPSTLMSDAGLQLPDPIAVFHLRHETRRSGRTHRLPDMLAWSDRLPHATKIVILDLGEVSQLDANAALELRALLQRFAAQRRRLIIAGLNSQQYELLRRTGAGDALDPTNVCPDLELAIARGLALLES